MDDLFRSYWWLLFPMAWFLFGGFSSFLRYRRQKDTLKLIQTYAERGQEPPEALLKILDSPIDSDGDMWRAASVPSGESGSGGGALFSTVLFTILAAGFSYASYADIYGAGEAFLIVAFVMGALAAATLVQLLFSRRRRD
jgi:hypothetical protein